jgi:molybdenum cofactor cytidylyltransferase
MSTASRRVAAVVLAAGASSRMGGRNKLLLRIGGEPLVRRAARAAADALLDPVIVVVGHEADRVREALGGVPCVTVPSPDYALGQRLSLQAGLRAVPADASAALVALADMPLVTSAMMAAVRDAYLRDAAPLVASRYGGVLAPPTLYDRALFPELVALTGAGAGKPVLLRHLAEATVVSWPEEALVDVDRPEDYERLTS